VERRQAIFELLCKRRHEKIENLMFAFSVSRRTIIRDIEVLTLTYPIETIRGRYGGGVKVADWYHPNRLSLCSEQMQLLKKLAPALEGDDLSIMNSILSQFSPR